MPKILVHYDPGFQEFVAFDTWDWDPNPEYDVIVDIKSGTWKEMQRNISRTSRDQNILQRLFIEAQMAGRPIRER